jgi:hypothetical protein
MEPINKKIQTLVDMYLSRELLLPECSESTSGVPPRSATCWTLSIATILPDRSLYRKLTIFRL